MKINHLWELKKLKKTILNDMQWILYQKRILKKKKLSNLLKIAEIFDIFEISKLV